MLPKKYSAATALFKKADKYLLVKPTYKDGWELPGGIIEANESPCQAVIREVREELGIDIPTPKLIYVDYSQANKKAGDGYHFVFDCGELGKDIEELRLPADELCMVEWYSIEAAQKLLDFRVYERLKRVSTGLNYFETHDGIDSM